jgi:hypothetical protein
MNFRQRLQIMIFLLLVLFAFASYHTGTGGTAWLQWLTAITIVAFVFVFDVAFTNDSQFIFDPDAENWKRRTVRTLKNVSEYWYFIRWDDGATY